MSCCVSYAIFYDRLHPLFNALKYMMENKLRDMEQVDAWNPQQLMQSPMFAPLLGWLEKLGSGHLPTLNELNLLLAEHMKPITVSNGKPLCFVAQVHGRLPFEAQYEPRCFLSGEVQTRTENLHDLFNALVWLAFPQAKAVINVRHYEAAIGGSAGKGRGSGRDMLTLFDESGVVVVYADEELAGLLRGFQWKELFWERRRQMQANMGFYLFGHGLYEKAMQPYVGMTGHGLLLAVEPDFFALPLQQKLARLDALLAAYLNEPTHCRSTRELTPVPLLGVPGWAAENEDQRYYENTRYFRAGRQGGAVQD